MTFKQKMIQHQSDNRAFWNELTAIHEISEFYDVDSFLKGRQTLHDIELEALGDVKNKSLLHLQCHFGMDSLSWSRLGAHVTGVDFADAAIELAQRLNDRLGLNAKFIQSDVYELESKLEQQFDIVVTSYGVLCWLKNLAEWGRIVARFLKPGGTFLLVEEHPISYVLDENADVKNLKFGYPYFDKETITLHEQYSYADSRTRVKQPVHYEWTYTLSEVFQAILSAGLIIREFQEYPFSMYQKFAWLQLEEDGWWHAPSDSQISLPLLFLLMAVKPDQV